VVTDELRGRDCARDADCSRQNKSWRAPRAEFSAEESQPQAFPLIQMKTGHKEAGGKHETRKWVWLFHMR
jgi:hypothetical protein